MEISLNKFTHCKLRRCQTLRSDTQIAAETVRPSNRWPLKKIANFSRNLCTDQIDQTPSLLHSERLSKFWLLGITRVYHARHVKRHFASDKQTTCWHELSKVTNQRVYQELVYQNEVFKTMLTGSPVVPFFSTRPRSSPARPLFQSSTLTESLEQAIGEDESLENPEKKRARGDLYM